MTVPLDDPLRRHLVARHELPKLGILVSNMCLWRWMNAGKFPRAVKLGGRNFWRYDELLTWIDEQPRWGRPRDVA